MLGKVSLAGVGEILRHIGLWFWSVPIIKVTYSFRVITCLSFSRFVLSFDLSRYIKFMCIVPNQMKPLRSYLNEKVLDI